jgi:hypothetical protein
LWQLRGGFHSRGPFIGDGLAVGRVGQIVDGDAEVWRRVGDAVQQGELMGTQFEIDGYALPGQFRECGGDSVVERMQDASEQGVLPMLDSADHAADEVVRKIAGIAGHHDGTLEAIAGQDGPQMFRGMPLCEVLVRVDPQLENEAQPAADAARILH